MEENRTEITTLQQRLIQVFLHLGCCGFEKIDRKSSEDLDTRKKTKRGVAKVTKRLVPESAIKPIKGFDRIIRARHDTLTMSVGTGGTAKGRAVLPVRAYLPYCQEMDKLFAERRGMVDEFINETYSDIRDKAQEEMGEFFNASEFPEPADLPAKFTCKVEVQPLPSNDRLLELCDLPDDVKEGIYADAERLASERNEQWQKDAFNKLIDPIKHMADICLNPKSSVYETTFDKLHDVLDMAEVFNLEGSDEFSEMISSVRRKLVGVDIGDIRGKENQDAREEYGEKAKEAMEEIMKVMGVSAPEGNGADEAATEQEISQVLEK